MYTFDDPKIDRIVLKTNIQESSLLTQKLKNQMIQLENLPPSENEKELQLLFNSQEYKNTVNRIDELSQNELNLISDDPKNNLYKKRNSISYIHSFNNMDNFRNTTIYYIILMGKKI